MARGGCGWGRADHTPGVGCRVDSLLRDQRRQLRARCVGSAVAPRLEEDLLSRAGGRAAGLALVISLAVAGCASHDARPGTGSAGSSDSEQGKGQTPQDVAIAYYQAMADANGEQQCALMTPDYRKSEVEGLSGTASPTSGAGVSQCATLERHWYAQNGYPGGTAVVTGTSAQIPSDCEHDAGVGFWAWIKNRPRGNQPELDRKSTRLNSSHP